MTPCHYSLPFLPATPSSRSQTFEGIIELTQKDGDALQGASTSCVDSRTPGIEVVPSAKVPGHS